MKQKWKHQNVNSFKLKTNQDRSISKGLFQLVNYKGESEDLIQMPELKMQHQQSQSSDKKTQDSNQKARAESSKLKKWDLPVKPVKVQKSKEMQRSSQQFVECFSKLDKDGLDFLRKSISRREQFNDLYARKFDVEEELEYGSEKSNQDEIEEEIIESCGGKEDVPEIIDEIINEEIQKNEVQLQPIRQMQNKEKQRIVKKARPISAKVENTVQNKVFKVVKAQDSGFIEKPNQNQSFSVGKNQSFDIPHACQAATGVNLFQKNKGISQQNKIQQLQPIKENATESYNENKLSKQNLQQVIGILKLMKDLNKNQQDQLVKAIETMGENELSEELLNGLLKNESSASKVQQEIEQNKEIQEQKPIKLKLNFDSAQKKQEIDYLEEKKEQYVFKKKKKKEQSKFVEEEIQENELIVEEDKRMKCVIKVISTWGCVIHAGLTEVQAFDNEGNFIELNEYDLFLKNSKNSNKTSNL